MYLLVNESPSPLFGTSSGKRQGHQLLPFLLTIVAEASGSLGRVEEQFVKGFMIGNNGLVPSTIFKLNTVVV